MKNVKRILKLIALSSIISVSIATTSYAQPKDDGIVNITPIFTEKDGPWYPGKLQSNNFTISNNGNRDIRVDKLCIDLISSKNNKTGEGLNRYSKEFKEIVENSVVILRNNQNILFEKKLNEILGDEGTLLNQTIRINSGLGVNLNMTISMDGEKIGNDTQAIESIFSIGANYKTISNPGGGGSGGSSSEDIDKPEEPEEPENPGKPEEPGNPENPGSSEDTNKPSKPNKPGSSENESNVGGSTDKLPQTGSIVNSSTLTILGLSVVGIGIVLDRKSSSKKGGKIDE